MCAVTGQVASRRAVSSTSSCPSESSSTTRSGMWQQAFTIVSKLVRAMRHEVARTRTAVSGVAHTTGRSSRPRARAALQSVAAWFVTSWTAGVAVVWESDIVAHLSCTAGAVSKNAAARSVAEGAIDSDCRSARRRRSTACRSSARRADRAARRAAGRRPRPPRAQARISAAATRGRRGQHVGVGQMPLTAGTGGHFDGNPAPP